MTLAFDESGVPYLLIRFDTDQGRFNLVATHPVPPAGRARADVAWIPGRGQWPIEFWPLRIPLDHALYTDGLAILERQVGQDVGPDHYPVFVVFALAPK